MLFDIIYIDWQVGKYNFILGVGTTHTHYEKVWKTLIKISDLINVFFFMKIEK